LLALKIILPIDIATELQGHLPDDIAAVQVDSEGNLDGDATDAEVYFSWFFLKPSLTLFLENFNRYRLGKPLRNVVDQTAGY
jgi:hypothetical protein